MYRRYRKPKFNWTILVAAILIGALIFTIFSKNEMSTHMAYTEENKIATDAGSDAEDKIDSYMYTDETYGFTIEIPVTWRELAEENAVYFVDEKSSASIKITGTDYYPSVNAASAESTSQDVIDKGNTYVNFSRISENHYELIYQDKGNIIWDYMDEVFWSRDDVLTVSCIFKDSEYEDLIDDYTDIIDSFVWEPENVIPEGYELYYSDIGAFEIGVPSFWITSIGEGSIVSSDTENGCTLTVSAEENQDSLANLTSLDITNLLNQGQENFLIQSFNTSETEADASARFLSDDQWNYLDIKILTNKRYRYSILIQYPDGTLSENVRETINGLFRDFL